MFGINFPTIIKNVQYRFMKKYSFFLIISFLLISCYDKTSTNPNEVYQLWTGIKPSKEIKVINGEYWESGHWTKEYILFLELEADKSFWKKFKKENNLVVDTIKNEIITSEQPEWFTPSKNSIKYRINDNFDQGSRYYEDLTDNKIYIYEIQL